MSDDRKSKLQKIEQYRLYATQGSEEIEKKSWANTSQLSKLAQLVYKDGKVGSDLFKEISDGSPKSQMKAAELAEKIRKDPAELGQLRGGLLNPSDREKALKGADDLASVVERRAQLLNVSENYDDLWRKAVDAYKLPDNKLDAALDDLKASQELADAAKGSRLSIDVEAQISENISGYALDEKERKQKEKGMLGAPGRTDDDAFSM